MLSLAFTKSWVTAPSTAMTHGESPAMARNRPLVPDLLPMADPPPTKRVGPDRAWRQAAVRFWSLIGSERIRLPVAANSALHKAGASGGRPGSPTPPQVAPLGTSTTSTF